MKEWLRKEKNNRIDIKKNLMNFKLIISYKKINTQQFYCKFLVNEFGLLDFSTSHVLYSKKLEL